MLNKELLFKAKSYPKLSGLSGSMDYAGYDSEGSDEYYIVHLSWKNGIPPYKWRFTVTSPQGTSSVSDNGQTYSTAIQKKITVYFWSYSKQNLTATVTDSTGYSISKSFVVGGGEVIPTLARYLKESFKNFGGFSHAKQRSSVFVSTEEVEDSFYHKQHNGQCVRTGSSSEKQLRYPWGSPLSDSRDILRRKLAIANSSTKHAKVFFLQYLRNRSFNRLLRQMGFCYPLQSFSRRDQCNHQFGRKYWLWLNSFVSASFQGGASC